MIRVGILAVVLMTVWLLFSGHYTPLIICFGVVSVGLVTWLSHRIGGTDSEALPVHMFARLPLYCIWLFGEIIKSNIATARVILGNAADPEIFETEASQQSQAGIATYANSITLTPGTVTVAIEGRVFLVHAIGPAFGADVRSRGMDAKVSAIENGGGGR